MIADGYLRLVAYCIGHGSDQAKLGVSPATIAFHVKHIYQKLQVHSKSEAVVKALRDGLID